MIDWWLFLQIVILVLLGYIVVVGIINTWGDRYK